MKKVQVTLKKSGINRPWKHKLTLLGLGLTKMHKTVTLNDTPAIRGMIQKVIHLVEVREMPENSTGS